MKFNRVYAVKNLCSISLLQLPSSFPPRLLILWALTQCLKKLWTWKSLVGANPLRLLLLPSFPSIIAHRIVVMLSAWPLRDLCCDPLAVDWSVLRPHGAGGGGLQPGSWECGGIWFVRRDGKGEAISGDKDSKTEALGRKCLSGLS